MNTKEHAVAAPRRGGRGTILALAALAALAGCAPREGGAGGGRQGGHVHVAPHGGTLVELGAHQYNVEFVFDAGRSVLQAYVLDGHAESFVRIGIPEFVVTAQAGGQRRLLLFRPVANPVTGEVAGNTSLFEAPAEWLASAKAFDGTLQAINVRGTAFTNIPFKFSLARTPDDPWAKKKN